ncbi:YHYH protein [Phragmitibacter flavus]|uniref:YHYH protein n=1 Tax=Phragmitibacter flavus TaxID=2576071 RepID=A0A5R8KEI1_9BACT|nr:YHYH protein [Phragmitibacter flavus]
MLTSTVCPRIDPRLLVLLWLVFFSCWSFLAAHPDHSVNQRGVVKPVPSTQAAPADATVTITIEGDKRVITANGLPDHATGRFPNRDNPHRITAQRYQFTVPLSPVPAPQPVPLVRQPFGIALNGVVFDPGTAETWQNDRDSGWHYEALGSAFSLGLDTNHGHVQPSGAYHYHGIPVALLERLSGGRPGLTLLGWAADGYPIYGRWGYRDARDAATEIVVLRSSYRLKSGLRPTSNGQPGCTYDGVFIEDFEFVAGSGDLDACGGRFGVSPEFPKGTYHYVLTDDFPFVPRLFYGTPDPSFARRGGPGPNNARRPPPRGNAP